MTGDVIVALAILSLVVTSTAFGVTLSLSYLVMRMLRSDGWDSSNITNALRLIAHVAAHPEDFAHMYYTSFGDAYEDDDTYFIRRPAFPYINQDELSEVVGTRPTREETL